MHLNINQYFAYMQTLKREIAIIWQKIYCLSTFVQKEKNIIFNISVIKLQVFISAYNISMGLFIYYLSVEMFHIK